MDNKAKSEFKEKTKWPKVRLVDKGIIQRGGRFLMRSFYFSTVSSKRLSQSYSDSTCLFQLRIVLDDCEKQLCGHLLI